MVRTYVRKTPKNDPGNIRSALRAIQNGMTIRDAARDFGIHEATLRRQMGRNQWIVSQNPVQPTV